MQTKQEVLNNLAVDPTVVSESTITITEPTRSSRRFEDNVTVIRIFKPDQERMVAALRYILRQPLHRKEGEVE